MGQQTVGQPLTKIRIIKGGDGLLASSGHNGLGQQLAAIVDEKKPEFVNQPYVKSIVKLQEQMRPLINKSFETAGYAARVMGNAAALDAICGSLLAAPFKDGLKLIEISPQVAVECMSDELPFISMGSGEPSADPFLGFLRKVYWPTGRPTLNDGVLAAYWTVQHAIDMKVSGVGFTADVFVVQPEGKGYVASQLTEAQLAEHNEFMKSAEEFFAWCAGSVD